MTAICTGHFICYGQARRPQVGGSSDLKMQLKTGAWHAAHKKVYRQFGSSLEILSTVENMETTSQPPILCFPSNSPAPPPPRNGGNCQAVVMLPRLVKENVKKIKEDPSKCQPDLELLEKKHFFIQVSVTKTWVTLFCKWKPLIVTQACFLCPTPI